jgi:hypothetical protein
MGFPDLPLGGRFGLAASGRIRIVSRLSRAVRFLA